MNALAVPTRRKVGLAALLLAVSLIRAGREIIVAVVLVVAQPAPVDAGAAVAPELSGGAAARRRRRRRAIRLVTVVPAIVLAVADPVQVNAGRRVVAVDDAGRVLELFVGHAHHGAVDGRAAHFVARVRTVGVFVADKRASDADAVGAPEAVVGAAAVQLVRVVTAVVLAVAH